MSDATRDRVRALARINGESADDVVRLALRELERRRFWEAYEQAHAAEQEDPDRLRAVAEERRLWQRASLADERRAGDPPLSRSA